MPHFLDPRRPLRLPWACPALLGLLCCAAGASAADLGYQRDAIDRHRYELDELQHRTRAAPGLQLRLGYGGFDTGDSVDNLPMAVADNADIEMATLTFQGQLRNGSAPRFGFSGGVGLGVARYSWESQIDSDDLEVLAIGPRLEGSYDFLFSHFIWSVGAHVEFGFTQTSDFSLPGNLTFNGQRDEYFLTGLNSSLSYRFAYGGGPELGVFAQYDHRRVRFSYDLAALGVPDESSDLAQGAAWTAGIMLSYRF